MMTKIRRAMSEKRGFTLVELVVVLVILAILAALLMPSLTGYIDKAKEKRVVAEVHQVVTAAQSLADEAYALAASDPTADTYVDAITLDAVAGLAEVKGELEDVRIEINTGKIAYVELELGGITGYYTPDDGIITSLQEKLSPPKDSDETTYVALENVSAEG